MQWMRTVEWDSDTCQLKMIDQRKLPGQLDIVTFDHYADVAEAIRTMVVRGAPAIGVAAAFGIALAAFYSKQDTLEGVRRDLKLANDLLGQSRPTAVNLFWALDRMNRVANQNVSSIVELRDLLIKEAQILADEDIETNLQMARIGSELINDGDTIIHHCNTGALATVDWGTALGVIRMAHEQGKRIHVLVDETRPRLQGARLTAWELSQYKIPYDIITDNAAGFYLRQGEVQKVLFGADRVASNGDVANKIGSYMLALAAHANDVPVYAVFPTSTIDMTLRSGDEIPIENRGMDEVLDIQVRGEKVTPEGATARNPAFDVTPGRLLSGLITEKGVLYPPYRLNLSRLFRSNSEI